MRGSAGSTQPTRSSSDSRLQVASARRLPYSSRYPTRPCQTRTRVACAGGPATRFAGCSDRHAPFEVVRRALELRCEGRSTKSIARELCRPRSTVRYWFGRYAGVAQLAEATDLKSVQCGFESLHQHQHPAYAYLFGMYFGDGCVSRMPRTHSLRIFLHKDQRAIADRVARALNTLLPTHRTGRVREHERVVAVPPGTH